MLNKIKEYFEWHFKLLVTSLRSSDPFCVLIFIRTYDL